MREPGTARCEHLVSRPASGSSSRVCVIPLKHTPEAHPPEAHPTVATWQQLHVGFLLPEAQPPGWTGTTSWILGRR